MLDSIVYWLTETIFALGYPGIVLLMALESSFFPFPSEVVMPPAGYLAAQGRMNFWIALGCGILGSLLGAVFNYAVARRLGRPLLHRYGRYFFLRAETLERAEAFFRRHGEIGTFIGRLVPLIRQYISLPAGLSGMRLDRFALYTAAGAGIWCAILVWIGWFIGQHASVLQQEEVRRLSTWATIALVPLIAVVLAWYIRRHRRRQKAKGAAEAL
ncbi:putative membrane protein [bacterium HR33]|nr:putative membrane protein [bacterium HR33]